MKKKWFYSAALAGLIAIPLMGFSSTAQGQTKTQPNQITLVSGGTSVPYVANSDVYHQPLDGIISASAGCQPDIHEFDKSKTFYNPFISKEEPEHIVFTAEISEFLKDRAKAEKFDQDG